MQGDRATAKPRKARRIKPTVVKAPAGDVASSGGDYGMTQARRAEQSKPVKRAQRAVYDAQPVARRQQINEHATGSVKANLAPIHAGRVARGRELARSQAQHDVSTDSDRQRAARYLDAHPEILHPDHPAHGGLIGTITGAAKLGEAAANAVIDAARSTSMKAAARIGGNMFASLPKNNTIASEGAKNAGRDLVDIPANVIPSLYGVAKQATEGRAAEAGGRHADAVKSTKNAIGILAQPYIDTAKHPIKSLGEHPIGTVLLASGVKGGAGRGMGKALRVAPSTKLRAIGATARAPIEGPGNIAAAKPHPYSKDIINKGGQVAAEKVKARRARRRGEAPPVKQMSEKDIARRVDADVAAGRTVAAHNESHAQKKAKKALGRKPTAATSAVAQGIANGSKADLQALIAEYRATGQTLTGESKTRNEATVALLEDALKKHDSVKVTAAAKAYSDMRAPGEAETVARGFVKPDVAEATRLAGTAVRRLKVQTGAEAPKTARRSAKEARVTTAKGAKAAKRQVQAADATFEKAFADARVSGARPKSSSELQAAERDLRAAVAEAARAKRANARAKVGASEAQGRAAVLSRNVGGPGSAGGYGVSVAGKAVQDSAQGVRAARAAVRDAERRVAAVKGRTRGVAPAEAEALRRAIAGRDDARVAASMARGTAKAARRAHVDTKNEIKKGAFVGPNGKLIPLSVVRGSKGPVEPVYVSHNPGGDVRPAAVPVEPPTLSVKAARSGKAIEEGTINLHPDQLIKQAGDSQRRLDAAKNYQGFLDEFSHRPTKGAPPEPYRTEGSAEAAAMALKDSTGIDWVSARTFDGTYHLVPKAAAVRLAQHAQHSDNLMSAFTRQWSKNVLAFSPRWLAGQLIEPGVRAGVAHAGPRSLITGRRVVKRINKAHGQEAADVFTAHTMSSGLQRVATRPLEHVGAPKEYTGLAKVMRDLPKKPGPKHLGQVYNAVTNFTMGTLNHIAQSPSQYAMLGKAIRDSDLMSAHTVKLSNAAIDDFVRTGGTDVNVMVALGDEVMRMNGKYNGFSPKVQAAIGGYTPFLAWTLNATNFLFHVMPKDHPVLTSLIVSANQATESWRKANGLYLDPFDGTAQGWLQGSIPGKGGSHLRLGRYVPFGLGNDDTPFLGPYADSILPQMSGVIAAIKGEDFTGTKLTGTHGPPPSLARKASAATASIGKGIVPLASQILNVAGVHTPDNADSRKVKPTVGARARSQFDPFMYTPGRASSSSAPVIVKRSGKRVGLPLPAPPPLPARRLPLPARPLPRTP